MLIDTFEQQKALIQFYLGVDVEDQPDNAVDFDLFAKLWGRLEFCLSFEGKLENPVKRHG